MVLSEKTLKNKNHWTSRINIEIPFRPNERLFDLTQKTPKCKFMCIIPHFWGRRYRKWTLTPKKWFLLKNECIVFYTNQLTKNTQNR